jgi:hypothetical protein
MWLRNGAHRWSASIPAPQNWDPYMQLDNLISQPVTP